MVKRTPISLTNDNLTDFIKKISEIPRDVFLKQVPRMIAECYIDRYFTILCYLEKFTIHFDDSQLYECINWLCLDHYNMLGLEDTMRNMIAYDISDIDGVSEYNNYMINEIRAATGNQNQFDVRVDELCGIRYADYNTAISTDYTNTTNTTNTTDTAGTTNTTNTQTNRILYYLSMITHFDTYICKAIIGMIGRIDRSARAGTFGYNPYSSRMEATNITNSGVLVDSVSIAIFSHRGLAANIDLFLSLLFGHRPSGYTENVIVYTILKYNKRLLWNILAAYITRTTIKHLHITRRGIGHRPYQRDYRGPSADSLDVLGDPPPITWRDEVIKICSSAINALTYDDIVEFERNDKHVTMFVRAFMRTYHSMSFAEVIIEQLLKKGLSLDIKGNQPHSLRDTLMMQGYHINKKIHNAIVAFG